MVAKRTFREVKGCLGTIRRMEGFAGPIIARTDTLASVVVALEKAGIEFLNDGSPGVRVRPQKH